MFYILRGVNTKPSPESLLQQIRQIEEMERGKVCVLREGPSGPYYNLQTWENGKNISRYLPREQVPAVQEAILGYEKFQELTGQYAEQVIARTREVRAAGSKKKNVRPRSSSPRTLRSRS